MITSIARQSIIFKCTRQQSVLVGNYEFYYVAGLMNKCFGLKGTKEMNPKELYDYISENKSGVMPQNPQEEYLLKLVEKFEPLEAYDQQMQEMFEMGANEENMWLVHI